MNDFNTIYPQIPAQNPNVQAVKRSAGSVLFLLATVTYTANLILSLVNLLTQFVPGSVFYSAMRNAAMLEPDIAPMIPAIQSMVMIFAIAFLVPTLLASIGFWSFYASAKNRMRPVVSTGGLSLVQAVIIIRLVGVSLLVLLLGVLLLPLSFVISEYSSEFYYSSSYYTPYDMSAAIIIGVLVLLLVFLIFYIIYYAKALGTIASVKAASNGSYPAKPVSMFVIVMNFIIAGFSMISLISSLFTDFSLMSLASSLFNIAFLVLLSLALLQFRREMQNQAYSMPMPPITPGPQVPPYSQQTPFPSYQPEQPSYQPVSAPQPEQPFYQPVSAPQPEQTPPVNQEEDSQNLPQ